MKLVTFQTSILFIAVSILLVAGNDIPGLRARALKSQGKVCICHCACESGYTGDGLNCADIDECAAGGTNNCNANAACTNTDGGFTCACNSGYTGNGVSCTIIYSVLLLADVINAGTNALVTALTNNDIAVEIFQPDFQFDVTNITHPTLSDRDCVIHLKGNTFNQGISNTATEQALADMVRNGGCYIGAQWLGYERKRNTISVVMDDLVLGGWDNGGLNPVGVSYITFEQVTTNAGHPLLENIPTTFTFASDSLDNSPRGGGSFPSGPFSDAIDLMKPTNSPYPSVIARELDMGRVIYFSWAANYEGDMTLQDANVQQLYVNAVKWGSNKS